MPYAVGAIWALCVVAEVSLCVVTEVSRARPLCMQPQPCRRARLPENCVLGLPREPEREGSRVRDQVLIGNPLVSNTYWKPFGFQ